MAMEFILPPLLYIKTYKNSIEADVVYLSEFNLIPEFKLNFS